METTKFEESDRDIVVGDRTSELLTAYREEQRRLKCYLDQNINIDNYNDDEDWVFGKPDGTLWNPGTLSDHFKKIAISVGLPAWIKFHHLRHNYVTKSIDMGMDRKAVSKAVGHASEEATENYDHDNYERKKKAANNYETAYAIPDPETPNQKTLLRILSK